MLCIAEIHYGFIVTLSAGAQNILRETGGLKFIEDLWNVSPYSEIKNASMCCLASAIDQNGQFSCKSVVR